MHFKIHWIPFAPDKYKQENPFPDALVDYIGLLYFTTKLVLSHIFLRITIFREQVEDLKHKKQKEEVVAYLSSLSNYKLCSVDMIEEVMLVVLVFEWNLKYFF